MIAAMIGIKKKKITIFSINDFDTVTVVRDTVFRLLPSLVRLEKFLPINRASSARADDDGP